ncbi:flavin reductase [Methylobacterium iners]|uniref:FMN reductase (NADH) RutF n=1 Tax=Methylobacterium iners TaxID=418707 RepID=A0ABQ4RR82_9HYPH|nr:flavin reductase [Methylobacterium iners]GJD93278.1 FMN reductase (NADH) RutF [Methylobacterium iners]
MAPTGTDAETGMKAVEAGAYRAAMAGVASAVHLVTTDGPGGRAGFTASAVCSVSDAPPTLLVCVNRSSSAFAAVAQNAALCVSTLSAGQGEIAASFGGGTPQEARFASGRWYELATGAPALEGALTAFDCRIVRRTEVGSHDVLFCEVVALSEAGTGDALVYADRRYHSIPVGMVPAAQDAA